MCPRSLTYSLRQDCNSAFIDDNAYLEPSGWHEAHQSGDILVTMGMALSTGKLWLFYLIVIKPVGVVVVMNRPDKRQIVIG